MHSADHVHNADTVGMNYRPKQFLNYFSATLYNSNTKLIFKAFYCFLHPRTICIMNYEAVHFSNFILFYFIINYTRRYPATISQHKCWFSITIPMSLSTTILFIFPGSGQVKLVLKTSLIYLLKALSLGSNGRQS